MLIDTRGMQIVVMSYARDGVPYVSRRPGQIGANAPGAARGWPIGNGVWVVRLDDCRNWAALAPPHEVVAPPDSVVDPLGTPPIVPEVDAALIAFDAVSPATVTATTLIVVRTFTPAPPVTSPPPIPLPAGLWLMLTALGALTVLRKES